MIRFEQVSKSFAKINANDHISFSCQRGEISGLLGINGAGKTTALKMLAGLLTPDTGNIWLDELNLHQQIMLSRKKMGVLLESNNLYNRLSCKEHIEQFAMIHGLKGKALKRAVDRVVAELDIADLLERRCEGFSTGEKMKVSLARILVYQPQYLILDEPTRGLDVLAVRQLRQLLKQLAAEGCCILFSSHVMQEVEYLCDHLIIIDKGRICRQGRLDKIKPQHSSDSLEEIFISTVNEAQPC